MDKKFFKSDDFTVIVAWVIFLGLLLAAGIVNHNIKTNEYIYEPVPRGECNSVPVNNDGCDIHGDNCAPVGRCIYD